MGTFLAHVVICGREKSYVHRLYTKRFFGHDGDD